MTAWTRCNRSILKGILLCAGLSWTLAGADDKAAPPPQPLRVLFVGNSQFYYNQMPKIVEVMAESAPKDRPRILADWRPSDRSVAGGATLERHWKFGTGKDTARGKITEEKWDYVVLQEFSGVASRESTNEYARLFHDLIRQHGAKTVLFSTAHVANKFPKGFQEINETNAALARELKVPVAAAGLAWLAYLGDNPTPDQILALYDPDKGHPGPKGSYLYACTLYALLTGQSPVGLTHRLPHLPENAIPAEEATRMQEAAWRAHQENNGKTAGKP